MTSSVRALVLAGLVGCSAGDDFHIGVTREALTPATPVWYNGVNSSSSDTHFGTTTVAAVPATCCTFLGCFPSQMIVSAWEERHGQVDSTGGFGVFTGRTCEGNSIPDNAGHLLTDADTGKAAGWPSSTEMAIIGRPHLFAIGDPSSQTAEWLALVALVGAPGSFATNIMIVLSPDGGATWKNPHLLGESSDHSGGFPGDGIKVDDVAAAVSRATDSYWLNGHTKPIQAVWTAAGGQFYAFLEWDSATADLILHPFTFGGNRQPIDAAHMNPPGTPPPNLHEMTLVAVDNWTPAFPGAVVVWPDTAVEDRGCSTNLNREPFMQAWHFMSIIFWGDQNWPLPAADWVEPLWPRCVGGVEGNLANPPIYRNSARGQAVFRPALDSINVAVSRARPTDPAEATEIAVGEFHFTNASDPTSLVYGGSPVIETPPSTQDYPTDQWLPTIATNGDGRWVHLSWVDVAGSAPTMNARNQPYGMFGSTYQNNALASPTRLFPSIAPYLLANDASIANDFDLGLWNAAVLLDETTQHYVDVLSDGRPTPPLLPPSQGGIFSIENNP